MEFIKMYMDDTKYRLLLNDMTWEIFGFSFEDWYNAGYFEGEYIPYSYIENGRIIANASANIMKFTYNGEEKLYIQIGTVMTRPEYRNRGLAQSLIKRILNDYKNQAEGFYLFANLNALGFYKRIGFQQMDQWRWSLEHPAKHAHNAMCFQPVGREQRDYYVWMLKQAAYNAEFDHINRCSLQMFYTMDMDDVYYCDELDSFIIMHLKDRILYLDSIICKKEISIGKVISRIKEEYDRIVFGFTPKDRVDLHAERYDGEDDYRLFYMGSGLECIEKDKLFLPIMSHA